MGFEGKVAIVTGSASGMGQYSARCLAERGASVVINDIDADKVDYTVGELRRGGAGYFLRCVTSAKRLT